MKLFNIYLHVSSKSFSLALKVPFKSEIHFFHVALWGVSQKGLFLEGGGFFFFGAECFLSAHWFWWKEKKTLWGRYLVEIFDPVQTEGRKDFYWPIFGNAEAVRSRESIKMSVWRLKRVLLVLMNFPKQQIAQLADQIALCNCIFYG